VENEPVIKAIQNSVDTEISGGESATKAGQKVPGKTVGVEPGKGIGKSGNGGGKSNIGERKAGKGRRWLLGVITLGLLGSFSAAFWYGIQLRQIINSLTAADSRQSQVITRLEQQLETEKSRRVEGDQAMAGESLEIRELLATQAESIDELKTVDRSQLLLTEIGYLIRLANQRLLIERRPQGALDLMDEVDKLARSINNLTGVVAFREALAKDITALRVVEVVDRVGIYSRLEALTPGIKLLTALPDNDFAELPTTIVTPPSPRYDESGKETSGFVVWYQRLWGNAKEALRRFSQDHFHVRYRDVPLAPLISGEQEQWIRHSMLSKVASAQQALLLEEQSIYDASLSAIEELLGAYFDSHMASALTEEVHKLSGFRVKQDLPDITFSSNALYKLTLIHSPASARGDSRP
jgi:uroporphyrin-III C-methyltransferase